MDKLSSFMNECHNDKLLIAWQTTTKVKTSHRLTKKEGPRQHLETKISDSRKKLI